MSRKPPKDKSYFQSSKAASAALAGHAWIPHTLELLTSPAWQALDRDGLRAITRLEIEHARHAGKENGRLKVSYDQYHKEAGIRRENIRRTLDWLCSLGLLAITHQGTFAVGGDNASEYRLTYLPSKLEQLVGARVYLQPPITLASGRHPKPLTKAGSCP
jgi:hypothetical protein